MNKVAKKAAPKKTQSYEFRPYRILFLVVLISVTSLVVFALLSATAIG